MYIPFEFFQNSLYFNMSSWKVIDSSFDSYTNAEPYGANVWFWFRMMLSTVLESAVRRQRLEKTGKWLTEQDYSFMTQPYFAFPLLEGLRSQQIYSPIKTTHEVANIVFVLRCSSDACNNLCVACLAWSRKDCFGSSIYYKWSSVSKS